MEGAKEKSAAREANHSKRTNKGEGLNALQGRGKAFPCCARSDVLSLCAVPFLQLLGCWAVGVDLYNAALYSGR
jgi:hypothetical protein